MGRELLNTKLLEVVADRYGKEDNGSWCIPVYLVNILGHENQNSRYVEGLDELAPCEMELVAEEVVDIAIEDNCRTIALIYEVIDKVIAKYL